MIEAVAFVVAHRGGGGGVDRNGLWGQRRMGDELTLAVGDVVADGRRG